MQVDPEFLKKHYASLSDEAFDDIDRNELTGVAQKIYDEERGRREPAADAAIEEKVLEKVSTEPEPDWISEAICACTFRTTQGQYNSPEAQHAREALEAAGIAVHTGAYSEPPDPAPSFLIQLMVPSNCNLMAESVLDLEIYNPQIEETWRTHLATLSDREFGELNFEALIAGLTDRVERLRGVYKEEVSARRS